MENKDQLLNEGYPAGKRELIFALGALICGLLLANMTAYGGFHLGFAIGAGVWILWSAGYLLFSRKKPDLYALSILAACLGIAASFARSDDGFIKFVMVCFLIVGVNLGLGILAGKNLRNPGGVASLLDAGFVLFKLGFGELPPACKGLTGAFRRSGTVGQKSGAILLGLCIALPMLLIIIPLLVSADAMFEGLLDLLPEFSVEELVVTVIFGTVSAFILFTRGTALRFHSEPAPAKLSCKGLAPLTVNTFLTSVDVVYCVYLLSQIAYFSGGFSGILPEEYTLAEYARRGFFEMAMLCCVNLSVMILALAVCRKEKAAPLSTRLLCLFLGLVTLFLVATASAKMVFYIQSYGLTRLRVLTQVMMVFMALVTALVSVWLFLPNLPYMKGVVLMALIIGGAVSWADVDTQVARYNTEAYLSGYMAEIDMAHMGSLGEGALPYLDRLSREAKDSMVRQMAQDLIDHHHYREPKDWRSWNYVNSQGRQYAPAEILHEGNVVEHHLDSKGRALYLIVGAEGVAEIEVSTPYSSGGCIHADGSPLKKGEKLWLEQVESLSGVSITARDKFGEVIWSAGFPEDTATENFVVMDDWIISVE